MSNIAEDLLRVALELKAAKLQEAIAKDRRIEFEERIIALIPKEMEVNRGQTTVPLSDGSKIVTKAGITVKSDIEEIREIFGDLGYVGMYCPIAMKTTYSLDLDGYAWYKKHHPDIYNLIAEYVTVTPKKIGVELKPAKKEK